MDEATQNKRTAVTLVSDDLPEPTLLSNAISTRKINPIVNFSHNLHLYVIEGCPPPSQIMKNAQPLCDSVSYVDVQPRNRLFDRNLSTDR